MITTAELHTKAEREGLRFDQVEKDYVILHVLSALATTLGDASKWTFKGGTCLRHCYYPGYRFSEDIDFSCEPTNDTVEVVRGFAERISQLVESESGLMITPGKVQAPENEAQVEISLQYSRGGSLRQALPVMKLHLTFDEPVLVGPVRCQVNPGYLDLAPFGIFAYSKLEIVAEKMRALLQQQEKWPRPRDLFDLWFILCRVRERFSRIELRQLFLKKCEIRTIVPDVGALTSHGLREWNRAA